MKLVKNHQQQIKRIIDIAMSIILVFLMAYQVTGEKVHEWIGIIMFILVITHQVLNMKWYSSLFIGKYNINRVIMIIINVLLLLSFTITAVSGMSMSNYAVPFLYKMFDVSVARELHLVFSYWSFILMGLHIGIHVNLISININKKIGKTEKKHLQIVLESLFIIIAGYGFCLFLKSEIVNYISFRTRFAFLDYEKNQILVLLENIAILIFFVEIMHYIISFIRKFSSHNIIDRTINRSKNENIELLSLIKVSLILLIGITMYIVLQIK